MIVMVYVANFCLLFYMSAVCWAPCWGWYTDVVLALRCLVLWSPVLLFVTFCVVMFQPNKEISPRESPRRDPGQVSTFWLCLLLRPSPCPWPPASSMLWFSLFPSWGWGFSVLSKVALLPARTAPSGIAFFFCYLWVSISLSSEHLLSPLVFSLKHSIVAVTFLL